jgi:2-amino-4-hydroxy-6-hydroxymethyldihydropteridine diphosphokinase
VASPSLAWIGLGANLPGADGEPADTLRAALVALAELPDSELRAASRLYESEPVDASGPTYSNQVAVVRTGLSPEALLDALQAIEQRFGRERPTRNAPRTLDLDLLLVDDRRIATPRLTLPHPRMHERLFVLMPLAELDPGLGIPGRGQAAALRDALLAAGGQRCRPVE